MADVISELLATDIALDKLGARGISADEAGQHPRNRHITVCNPRDPGGLGTRWLLIGRTDDGRALTWSWSGPSIPARG